MRHRYLPGRKPRKGQVCPGGLKSSKTGKAEGGLKSPKQRKLQFTDGNRIYKEFCNSPNFGEKRDADNEGHKTIGLGSR